MGEVSYTVYKHTTPSGKVYIGITNQKPERRWRKGNGYFPKSGEITPFCKAITKYGWNNITHEIIASHLTTDEACVMEKKLIKEYKANDSRYGYNVLIGGDIPLRDCPESVRQKMSESSYKKWQKDEYVNSHTGQNHWTHKKGYSQKSIDAMRNSNIGKKRSPEQIEFLRQKAKKQKRYYGKDNKHSKGVICLFEGKEIKRYGGILEATRETGISFQNISKVCHGERHTAGGYGWTFIGGTDNATES